jgi:hypothetical protein
MVEMDLGETLRGFYEYIIIKITPGVESALGVPWTRLLEPVTRE